MYKCKDCMNFVHNPQFWGNDDGKCEKDERQHWENQDCCLDFKKREKEKKL